MHNIHRLGRRVPRLLQPLFVQILLGIVLCAGVVGLSLASPFFPTWDNWRNILDHSSLLIIMSVGMTFVICTGGIDLSVGAVAALSGVCMAVAMHRGLPVPLAILLGMASGAAAGAVNGALIAGLRANPFIVTLGTMSVARGFALIVTGGIPIYGFPQGFLWWGSGHVGPVNPPIIMAFATVVAGAMALHMTRLGYYTLALGGGEEALRRSGVSTNLYKAFVYTLCGLTSAVGGLIVTARLNTAEPLAVAMIELDAIAAVVLGGTSMRGGEGSMAGTALACLLLGVLRNGLTILSVPSYYQQLATGLIILVSLVVSEVRSRREGEKPAN